METNIDLTKDPTRIPNFGKRDEVVVEIGRNCTCSLTFPPDDMPAAHSLSGEEWIRWYRDRVRCNWPSRRPPVYAFIKSGSSVRDMSRAITRKCECEHRICTRLRYDPDRNVYVAVLTAWRSATQP